MMLMLMKCKYKCKLNTQGVTVLAHELASLGCKLPGGDHTSWDDVPQFLEGLVSSDSIVTKE
jgi:hypothetical protein